MLTPVRAGWGVWISRKGGGEEKVRREKKKNPKKRGTWGKEKPPATIVFNGDRVSLGQIHRVYWTVPQQLPPQPSPLQLPQQSGRFQPELRGKGGVKSVTSVCRVCKENLKKSWKSGRHIFRWGRVKEEQGCQKMAAQAGCRQTGKKNIQIRPSPPFTAAAAAAGFSFYCV